MFKFIYLYGSLGADKKNIKQALYKTANIIIRVGFQSMNLFFFSLFAAKTCPANMIYSECAPGCPTTCKNLDMKCSTRCVPGCTCPEGMYHDGHKCVERDSCSCSYRDKIYDHNAYRYEPCQVW